MLLRKFKTVCLLSLGLLSLVALSAQAQNLDSLFRQNNDPIGGNPQGKVTIAEFFDYQCSHCIDVSPVVGSIIKNNKEIRVVFKELPIRGPISEFAARAALAANMQGKYMVFHDALFAASQPLSEEDILKIAKNVGLNSAKLMLDMNGEDVKKQLQQNLALAEELKLSGTPAFFVGKTNAKNDKEVEFVLGGMDQSQMQSLINKINK